jgi:hypothetical protein
MARFLDPSVATGVLAMHTSSRGQNLPRASADDAVSTAVRS